MAHASRQEFLVPAGRDGISPAEEHRAIGTGFFTAARQNGRQLPVDGAGQGYRPGHSPLRTEFTTAWDVVKGRSS